MDKELLRLKAERTFIKQECDRTAPNVQAAVISAAAKMAIPADMISESDVTEELIAAYKIEDDMAVQNLIGMAPQFVKAAIGYSVDFNDFAAAEAEYARDKNAYDGLYSAIKVAREEKQKAKGNL